MSVPGVDYAWDRPSIAGLAAVGKRFACRYGGPGSTGKQLDPVEARELTAAGLSIVANAEGAEDGLLGGRLVGIDWARKALVHFRQCGMPDNRPIYLSVDFDVMITQWPQVRAALMGAAEILGPERVGVYGGLKAVRWARRDGVAAWFWQTYAWSGGVWAADNHIQQYRNKVSLVGGTVDLDTALTVDYGQWGAKEVMTYDEVWRTDKMRNPYSDKVTNPTIQAETGMFNVMTHTWETNRKVATLATKVAALQTAVDALAGAAEYDHAPLIHKLEEVSTKLDDLASRPLIDAVAVANAIASDPTILAALASGVAARLASIQGTLSLTGSLDAGIHPPTS